MSQPDAGYPAPAHGWRVVLLIVLVAIVATLDRGVLSLVIDPIRHDLGISDVQVSLLQGLSFSLFYATVGVALGLWTDRVRRGRLLAAGMLLWSVATVGAGLSTGFWWMFASRLLVGMGEGTLGPCAISLICDLFPPKQRGRPLGIYLTGQAVSSGLSVMMTGAILRHLPHDLVLGGLVLPPWRVAFIVTGLLGLLVVPFMMMVREPARQETIAPGARLSVAQSLAALGARRGELLPLYLGFACIATGFYSTLAWGAVSVTRHYGLHIVQVTGTLGPASIVAGLVGPSLAGLLVDRVMQRSGAGDRVRLLAVMPLLVIPAGLGGLMPGAVSSILCLATMLGSYPALATVFFSVLQGAVPNELRGVSIALCGLINALVGATCGPLVVALLGQHVYQGRPATAHALSTTVLATIAASLLFFVVAWRRDARTMRDTSTQQPSPYPAASRG